MTSPQVLLGLTVFRGFPDKGCFVWSPFVTKLEARLRFSNISYRTEPGSILKAPRGKVPYVSIDWGHGNCDILADSALISKLLVESGCVEDLNVDITPSENLQDLSIRALLEDKLYFYQCYERWVLNYYTMRSKILGALPWLHQVIVGNIIYRKMVQTLEGQGTLKFSTDEIFCLRFEVWETINDHLTTVREKINERMTTASRSKDQDCPFWVLGGDDPTEADATVFGFIVSSLVCDAAPETKDQVKSYPVLLDYAQRIHKKYFPDYELWE